MHTASCLCQGIQINLLVPLSPINACHCKECQKAQGSAFVAIIPIQRTDLAIIKGEDLLQAYRSSPNKNRVFCRICGSPIYSERLDNPDVIRLKIGIINEPLGVKVVSHAYVADMPDWDSICDTAPQYQGKSPMSSQ